MIYQENRLVNIGFLYFRQVCEHLMKQFTNFSTIWMLVLVLFVLIVLPARFSLPLYP